VNASDLGHAYLKFLRVLHRLPLDPIDKMALMRTIGLTLNGFDARNEFGIKPKHGPPPQFSQKRVAMAAKYLTLCETGSDEKIIARQVSDEFGLKSLSYVRQAARDYRQFIEQEAEKVGWGRVMELAEGMIKMPNIL
jgi:hypothetical protein